MKSLVFWCLAAATALAGGDYRAAYAKLKAEIPASKMETHLAQWREAEPENPDAWILSANWFFEQAKSEAVEVTTKPAGKGDFVVTDPKTGEPVGSISSAPSYDSARTNAATGFLRTALKRWPQRIDIHCGLAHMLETTGAWEEEFKALRAQAAAAREHAGRLRWCHDEPLEGPEAAFVAAELHAFALHQFHRETPETDAHFHQIAKLLVEAFPGEPLGHNDLAIFYGLSKDWPAVQQALEAAAKAAPDDALVWTNLGDNSLRLDDRKRARVAYEKVIALGSSPQFTAHARAELAKLGADGKRRRAK